MSYSKAAIINVSSLMSSIDSSLKTRGNSYHYRASKAALNMVTALMSVELKSFGILAAAIHPGWVKTDMGGPGADLDKKLLVDHHQHVGEVIGSYNQGTGNQFLIWIPGHPKKTGALTGLRKLPAMDLWRMGEGPVALQIANDIMKPVNFECPDGESITAIQSWHSDWHDDRQWAFGCSKVPEPATLSNCKWTVADRKSLCTCVGLVLKMKKLKKKKKKTTTTTTKKKKSEEKKKKKRKKEIKRAAYADSRQTRGWG
nr:hypothetical protein BaRGS_005944 [Batillaria attramentaria]